MRFLSLLLLRLHQKHDCTLLLKVEDSDSSSTGESSLRLRKGVFCSISLEWAKKLNALMSEWTRADPGLADTHTSKVKLHLSAGSFQTAFRIKAHVMQNLSVAAECWGQQTARRSAPRMGRGPKLARAMLSREEGALFPSCSSQPGSTRLLPGSLPTLAHIHCLSLPCSWCWPLGQQNSPADATAIPRGGSFPKAFLCLR